GFENRNPEILYLEQPPEKLPSNLILRDFDSQIRESCNFEILLNGVVRACLSDYRASNAAISASCLSRYPNSSSPSSRHVLEKLFTSKWSAAPLNVMRCSARSTVNCVSGDF